MTDADNANLASATVTITNILNAGLETLAANTGGTPIAQAYNAGTGVLTLTGPATVAQFQQVLRTVTYRNTASPINLTTRVVRFVANDGVLPSNNGDKNVAITPLNAPVVTPSAGNTPSPKALARSSPTPPSRSPTSTAPTWRRPRS